MNTLAKTCDGAHTQRKTRSELPRHAIAAAVRDIIVELDAADRCSWANEAALACFGPQVVGAQGSDLGLGDVRKRLVERGDQPGEIVSFESSHQPGDHDSRVLAWRCHLLNRDGTVVAVGHDVTAERQQHADVRQAERLALLGRLASEVSHDFNNLLSGILCSADAALSKLPLDDPARCHIADIKSEVASGVSLTQQLLAMVRVHDQSLEAVDLSALVAQRKGVLQRAAGPGVELRVQYATRDARLCGNGGQLEQVLMNLVVNARDAVSSPNGRVTINVGELDLSENDLARFPKLRPGPHVVLSVIDNGCGMSQSTQDHAFDAFFSTKAAGDGNGLGLAIVKRIVDDHGGGVRISSEPNGGTAVHVYLPRGDMDLPAPHDVGVREGRCSPDSAARQKPFSEDTVLSAVRDLLDTPPSGIGEARGRTTVLVVDGHGASRRALSALLADDGYRVLSASTGAEAALLHGGPLGPADVVITDTTMSDMLGADLVRNLSLRAAPKGVVYVTGRDLSARDLLNGTELGHVFLQKPVAVEAVSAFIELFARGRPVELTERRDGAASLRKCGAPASGRRRTSG